MPCFRAAPAAALSCVLSAGMLAPAAAGPPAADLRLFTRQADCDRPTLEPTPAKGEGGCWLLGQPAAEVFHHTGDPLITEFAAHRGTHVLDARRDLRGTLVVGHFPSGRGVGLTIVDVTLLGTPKGGEQTELAGATMSSVANPAGHTSFPLDIDLPAALQGRPVADLVLRVAIRGASAPVASVEHDGLSFIDLPVVRRR